MEGISKLVVIWRLGLEGWELRWEVRQEYIDVYMEKEQMPHDLNLNFFYQAYKFNKVFKLEY